MTTELTQLIHLQCWTLNLQAVISLKQRSIRGLDCLTVLMGNLISIGKGNDLNHHQQDKKHQANSLIILERLSGHYIINSLRVRNLMCLIWNCMIIR